MELSDIFALVVSIKNEKNHSIKDKRKGASPSSGCLIHPKSAHRQPQAIGDNGRISVAGFLNICRVSIFFSYKFEVFGFLTAELSGKE